MLKVTKSRYCWSAEDRSGPTVRRVPDFGHIFSFRRSKA